MGRPAHGYTLADGTPVPGVTTICGLLNKPALVGWAGKTMHAHEVEMVKLAYQAGKTGARIPGLPRWTEVLYGARDKAADAGTQAHEAFERYLRGETMDRALYTDAALTAYDNAVHWLSTTALSVRPLEEPYVHPELKYGGTPDASSVDRGLHYLLDWKTGGLYMEVVIQLAAYAELLRVVDGVVVQGAHVVRFPRDGQAFHHTFISKESLRKGWRAFLNLRELWELKPELEAVVK